MEFKKKRKKDIHIDITPLVDTVFILLIFFALSLNFVKVSALNIQLPEISANRLPVRTDTLKIRIDSDEKIYFNGKNVDMLNNLKKKLAGCRDKRSATLIIEADVNVRHGRVVEVMDSCKSAGVRRIAIAAYIK